MPKIVVAFRVTIVVAFRVAFRWKPQVGSPDPQKHTPHDSLVLEEIQHGEEISFDRGQQNMWIISHSLGTTMEMFAGRQMAEEGRFLEDHIFNLPFVLAPMDKIREKKGQVQSPHRNHPSGCRAELGIQRQAQHHRSPQRLLRPTPMGSLPLC